MVDPNLPSDTWIVIDTNFLIDYYFKQNNYLHFISSLIDNNNTLVSIDFVKHEFIRSKTKETIEKKIVFFDALIQAVIPVDINIVNLVRPMIESYGADIEKVSLTDIYLGCTIQRYKKTILLTRNHIDFPTKLFDRLHIYSIGLEKDIKTYAFYQYKLEQNNYSI